VYRPPYEEYVANIPDGSCFAAQLYDIVVIRKCRPTLNRELKEKQYVPVRIRYFVFFLLKYPKEFILSRLSMNYVH
jgi:hypothetical protein